jgi:hypothetical protein
MYIKGIEAVFRAILYPESCIGIAFSCEEYSKEYFDEIKRIINKYEIVKREISEVGKTVINFKNGSHIDILKPTKNDPVIRGKRADISHWMYDYEAFGISNEDFEKVVEPF